MAKFFAAVLYKKEIYDEAILLLKERFGEIIVESEPYNFDFTDYYSREMGKGLLKRFIVFNKEIDKKELAEIRIFTGIIEDKFRVNGKRQINIDPGYISEKEVVLASVKARDFKEAIGNEVFAHKIYSFEDNSVKIFFHTFPDYKTEKNKRFFLSVLPLVNK